MESKIIKQEKNPFLDREEFVIEIRTEVPPKFEDVKKIIGLNEDLTVVKRVDGSFGTNKFTAEAVVYGSIDSKDKVEVIPQKVRKKMAAEKAEAEAAAKKAEEEAKKKAEEEAAAKAAEEEAKKAEEESKTNEGDTTTEPVAEGTEGEAPAPTEGTVEEGK